MPGCAVCTGTVPAGTAEAAVVVVLAVVVTLPVFSDVSCVVSGIVVVVVHEVVTMLESSILSTTKESGSLSSPRS